MSEVSIRDLRNHGGEIVDRVSGGEHVTITRAGKAVATLNPLRKAPLRADALIERWRRLPYVDPAALQRDLDNALDARL